jgi:O-acetylserine/cysteine efflux transporter
MSPPHILLALGIALVWGVNFVVMKVGLESLPPFYFAFLRFAFAAVPLVFFYRRPAVPWRLMWGYAATQFALQYAFLFVGLQLGVSAGLASAVIQLQAFFTIGLAILLLGEVPRRAQWYASALALAGMGVIAWHVEGGATAIGVLLVVCAGLSWAFGNIFTKRIALAAQASGASVNVMQVVAWASLLAALPLLLLSLVFEGPSAMLEATRRADWRSVGAVLVNAYVVTTFGFGAWSFLLRRYTTAMVAPFALLIPIVGMASGALLLDEVLRGWMLAAGLLVIAGLAINQYAGVATRRMPPPVDGRG